MRPVCLSGLHMNSGTPLSMYACMHTPPISRVGFFMNIFRQSQVRGVSVPFSTAVLYLYAVSSALNQTVVKMFQKSDIAGPSV